MSTEATPTPFKAPYATRLVVMKTSQTQVTLKNWPDTSEFEAAFGPNVGPKLELLARAQFILREGVAARKSNAAAVTLDIATAEISERGSADPANKKAKDLSEAELEAMLAARKAAAAKAVEQA